MRKLLFTFLFVMSMINIYAQDNESATEESLKGKHRMSLVLGHSHISTALDESGKRTWQLLPSIGFDYDYWLSKRLAIGMQSDIIIESFEIESNNEKIINRSYPLAAAVSVLYKATNRINLIAGMGGEFSKEEHFTLTRMGIETGWPLKNKWEFGVSLLYDIKWGGYDTWVFGFGISILF